jgi:hypothetical protein
VGPLGSRRTTMTPTLLGRWQIRIFLLPTIGLVIALIVSLVVQSAVPLFALLYVLLFGLVWDVLYQTITSYRWDRDWPTSFQVAAGVIEGALLWVVILTGKLPGIPQPPPFIVFLIEYGAIWLSIFLLTQGPLRVIWLKWRYQGGQWFVSRPVRPGQVVYQQQPGSIPQFAGGNYPPQPVQAPQFAGNTYLQQPAQAPQFVSGNYPQQLPPPPHYAGANYPQQPTPPPQVIRSSNPRLQNVGEQGNLPTIKAFVCACGFTSDRDVGNFCPQCGRPKV